MTCRNVFAEWNGAKDFGKAQLQVSVILLIAYLGNTFPKAYPRNENHSEIMFWAMNSVVAVAALLTLKYDTKASSRGVELLSRAQTEEWKGWMQWAFIMYHYYRAYSVYNVIRVFVSSYVWMTGFGNFLYFDKSQDFTLTRAVGMWLRINYFPLLLSFFLGVSMELYYVVPLHTAAFFVTMATCYLSRLLSRLNVVPNKTACDVAALAVCFVAHVAFYETPAANVLKLASDEYWFRFRSDKYSAWIGMVSGFAWGRFQQYAQWCFTPPPSSSPTPQVSLAHCAVTLQRRQLIAQWVQRLGGVGLIGLWWALFGHFSDKYVYNAVHPYCFWMPVAGWLMLRNSSRYLTELHSGVMEWLGRITLETYVLQFHVFMCRDVQYIPIVVPGSGPDGPLLMKTLNTALCGALFLALSYWARKVTVTTQTTVTDLLQLLQQQGRPSRGNSSAVPAERSAEEALAPLLAQGKKMPDAVRRDPPATLKTNKSDLSLDDDTIETVSTSLSEDV